MSKPPAMLDTPTQIENVGTIHGCDDFLGESVATPWILRKLLESSFTTFCTEAARIGTAFDGELPFIFRERQVSSIIIHSLLTNNAVVIPEYPIERKGYDSASNGRLDGLVRYQSQKTSASILLEIKHGYMNLLTSGEPRKKNTNAIRSAQLQLDKLGSKQARMLRTADFDSSILLALYVLVGYVRGKRMTDARKKRTEASSPNAQRLAEAFHSDNPPTWKNSSLWVGHWTLGSTLTEPLKWVNGYEIYPDVYWLAKFRSYKTTK